jgi:diamine N-acetyltransferase
MRIIGEKNLKDKLVSNIIEYDCPEIYLSIVEDNQAALHLYRKFGFAFNGESDYNNERLMVKKV